MMAALDRGKWKKFLKNAKIQKCQVFCFYSSLSITSAVKIVSENVNLSDLPSANYILSNISFILERKRIVLL